MKYRTIFLFVLFSFTGGAFSAEKTDCSNLKKFSMQKAWCKSKHVGKSIKNKISNISKKKNKN